MFTEKQFDNYNQAVTDLRKWNSKTADNIVAAFNLALKITPATLIERLKSNSRQDWFSVPALIWDGVVYILKIQTGAIVLGAIIGGVAGSEIPIFGTAVGATIGARIGATVASWYLAIIGLKTVASIIGQIGGTVSVNFENGIAKARAGDVQGGAKEIATGFARILEMIAAIIILYCFVKGGKYVLGKIKTQFATGSKLLSMMQGLPQPITNLQAFFATARWGYSGAEIRALLNMSKQGSGKFYVIRTCNPGRTGVGRGIALEAKNLEIKGASIEGGLHNGKVGVVAEDIAKLKVNYHFEELPKNSGYRLRLKQGKSGQFNNHILENADHVTVGKHSGKMVLLDANRNPYIPDMDRLICMEIDAATLNTSNTQLKDMAKFIDDPVEIKSFNNNFNKQLTLKQRINIEPAKHGYTSKSVNELGEPVWHAKENELLLIVADGKLFEMNWNQLVLFCEANKSIGLPQCFKLVAEVN